MSSSLSPMRPELRAAAELNQDSYDMREAIDWFKRVYLAGKEYETLAENEMSHMNAQWAKVVEKTDRHYKLPHGPLGQFLSDVAIQELILETAEEAVDGEL